MPSQYLTKDDIRWAEFSKNPPSFARPKRLRGRRAEGIRYEKKAHLHFKEEFKEKYVISPWIKYKVYGSNKILWAQPDGLHIDIELGMIIVCEMKYQHTSEAYWQTIGKYIPLVQKIFGTHMWKFGVVEIVKWYDCAVKFPAKVTLRDCISKVRPGEFGVHIWKP